MAIRRIVVGVDGSEPAANALLWTVEVARELDAEVTAVFALAPPYPLGCARTGWKPPYPCELDPNFRKQLRREFVDDWCRALRDSGLRYHTVFEEGHAALVIAAVAERENADFIVIGNRGRGSVVNPMPGSVGYDLSERSPKQVLLVTAGARPPGIHLGHLPAA